LQRLKRVFRTAILAAASVALIAAGHRLAIQGSVIFTAGQTHWSVVRVTEVLYTDRSVSEGLDTTTVRFSGRVVLGENRGMTLSSTQQIDPLIGRHQSAVGEGDLIFVYLTPGTESIYFAGDFFRLPWIALLGAVTLLALILFAGFKGAAAAFALVCSASAVFACFIPAVLAGRNIYLWTLLVCVYCVAVSPLLITGLSVKSAAVVTGCVSGLLVTAGLALLFTSLMKITGAVDEQMMMVSMIIPDNPIDLRALTFAAVIIGTLGAVIDTSMSISSAVCEFSSESTVKRSFPKLLSHGLRVGRDMVGAQISTLALAYAGSSVSTVLLVSAYQSSLIELLNLEMVIIELLFGFLGALTVIAVILTTALSASFLSCASRFDRFSSLGGGGVDFDKALP